MVGLGCEGPYSEPDYGHPWQGSLAVGIAPELGVDMNKDKWISMRLDGSAADGQIKSLLELRYDLTGIKLKKRRVSCRFRMDGQQTLQQQRVVDHEKTEEERR